MTTRSALMFCLLLAQVQAMAAPLLPKEVATFVERREGCDHFRGEEATLDDPHRAREINRELKKLCTGTDEKLLQLKQKYAANAEVTALLDAFEPTIEPRPAPPKH